MQQIVDALQKDLDWGGFDNGLSFIELVNAVRYGVGYEIASPFADAEYVRLRNKVEKALPKMLENKLIDEIMLKNGTLGYCLVNPKTENDDEVTKPKTDNTQDGIFDDDEGDPQPAAAFCPRCGKKAIHIQADVYNCTNYTCPGSGSFTVNYADEFTPQLTPAEANIDMQTLKKYIEAIDKKKIRDKTRIADAINPESPNRRKYM